MPLATVKVCQRGETRPRYAWFEAMETETVQHLKRLIIDLRLSGRLTPSCTDLTFDNEIVLCIPVGVDLQRALRVLERACNKSIGLYWERVDPADKEYEDARRAALMMRPHLERAGLNPEDYL